MSPFRIPCARSRIRSFGSGICFMPSLCSCAPRVQVAGQSAVAVSCRSDHTPSSAAVSSPHRLVCCLSGITFAAIFGDTSFHSKLLFHRAQTSCSKIPLVVRTRCRVVDTFFNPCFPSSGHILACTESGLLTPRKRKIPCKLFRPEKCENVQTRCKLNRLFRAS